MTFFYFFLKCTQASRKSVTPAGARMRGNGLHFLFLFLRDEFLQPFGQKKNLLGAFQEDIPPKKKRNTAGRMAIFAATCCISNRKCWAWWSCLLETPPRMLNTVCFCFILTFSFDPRQAELLQTLPSISRKSWFLFFFSSSFFFLLLCSFVNNPTVYVDVNICFPFLLFQYFILFLLLHFFLILIIFFLCTL